MVVGMQRGRVVPFVVRRGVHSLIGDDIKNVGGVREGFVWSFPVKLCLRVPSLVLVVTCCSACVCTGVH